MSTIDVAYNLKINTVRHMKRKEGLIFTEHLEGKYDRGGYNLLKELV